MDSKVWQLTRRDLMWAAEVCTAKVGSGLTAYTSTLSPPSYPPTNTLAP